MFNQPISDYHNFENWVHVKKLLSDWSIYLTVLHIIGHKKINEMLHDMTLTRMMLLYISVSPKKKCKRNIYNKHPFWIRFLVIFTFILSLLCAFLLVLGLSDWAEYGLSEESTILDSLSSEWSVFFCVDAIKFVSK